MIRDIAIYGAGGLGREMALLLEQINEVEKRWNLIGFFDDFQTEPTALGMNLLGGVHNLNEYRRSLAVLIAIADSGARRKIVTSVSNTLIDFPVIVHPQCILGAASNQIGRGSVLTAGCILTTGIVIREFVIVNLSVTVGHDVTIGAFSSLMPGAHISGNVTIGEGVLFGTGATILQNLKVGAGARIGAGAVVTKSVERGTTVVGVPAREVK